MSPVPEVAPIVREAGNQRVWVKREARTHVWVQDGICHKAYFVPSWLRWREVGRISRAQREHDNLVALDLAGVPAIRAVGWSERRSHGARCVSTVRTEWVGGHTNLREWLREPASAIQSITLGDALGAALARLHRCGFVCYTASPRNWLLRARPSGQAMEPGDVLLCDVVALSPQHRTAAGPRDLVASRRACIDLYSLALGKSRRREMSAAFRMRILLTYCSGDRRRARRLWIRVQRWHYRGFRLRKDVGMVADKLRATLARLVGGGGVAARRASTAPPGDDR